MMLFKTKTATGECRGWIVLLLSILAVQPAFGQSAELLVRLEEEGASSLRSSLQAGTIPKTGEDSLFVGVQSISRVAPRLGTTGKDNRQGIQPQPVEAYRLAIQDSSSLRRLRSRWQSHPNVRYAHPNYRFQAHGRVPPHRSSKRDPVLGGNNALADSLDHLNVVRAQQAWTTTAGTSSVQIGVIDTGFYLDHPDLAGQLGVNAAEDLNGNGQLDEADLNGKDDDGNGYVDDVIGYDFVDRPAPIDAGEFVDRDPDPSADPEQFYSWHGTAVAGVATAAPATPAEGIAGVAPGTRLVPLRALGGDGFGRTDDIVAAIVYAATQGIDVLNLSFGRDRAVPLIEEAIEYANAEGTIVVASAGNNLTDDPHYPSDYPEVLSVVWLGEDGRLPQFNRSQFGIGVDLGAPGSNVYTADFPAEKIQSGTPPSQSDFYRSPNGSSFSAPQVAGAAALLRSVDSTLSPSSVRSILTASADDIEGANWDHQTGAGLLDVATALTRAYPARTQIDRPRHNQGLLGRASVPIVGTAVDPAFRQYALYYAEGTTDLDARPDPWTEICPPRTQQILRDTLGTWSVSELQEGAYTLRLVTRLRDGRTIEDRRRVIIDRSPPSIDLQFLGAGRVEGQSGIIADVATDDATRARLRVQVGGDTTRITSEYRTRRHGLSWANKESASGPASIQIRATNASSLTTTIDTTLQLSGGRENPGLLRRVETEQPRGRLLAEPVDFDEDGLSEVLMNQFVDGGASDTLRSFEWDGSSLAPKDTLVIGPFFPKDVGDTNGDGRQELLLQVNAATLLLEQPSASGFPTDLIFADTSRISAAPGDTLNGARLTDLDADGRGEVVGSYRRRWRVVERREDGFEEIAYLENPTEIGPDPAQGNVFDFPEALTGDFDGDGRRGLLVGDRDGDLLIYEATGNDQFAVAWTFETDRVNAGTRFTKGDFDGDGSVEFVTMTTNSTRTLSGGGRAPSLSYYSVWESTGDNTYERAHRFPIEGVFTTPGALAAADMDTDGRPEVVIAHPPSLLVLDRSDRGDWRVRFEDRPSSVLSRSLLAADVSGSGTPSIFAGTNDGELVRYVVDPDALAVSPPRWIQTRPGGDSSAVLRWRAPRADSVAIYAGSPGSELNRLRTTTDSTATIAGDFSRRFALRAWRGEQQSPLSASRLVRPHEPASVASTAYPSASSVRVSFTEPLATTTRTDQFAFGAAATSPRGLTRVGGGKGVVLDFPDEVAGQTGTLSWRGLTDETGLPVAPSSTELAFPTRERRTLFVEKATILGERRLRLSFNEPLDPAAARQRDRYDVQPRGRVANVQMSDESSSTVTLRVEGLVIGARGEEASLTVTEMTSTTGNRLSKEGSTVRLTRPAEDLSNVYIYPNPYRDRRHGDNLTIAGLPPQATIQIYTPDGRLVRVLSVENNRDGGRRWNLRNREGERVPSGVYLFRVSAPNQSSVLEKAAVLR